MKKQKKKLIKYDASVWINIISISILNGLVISQIITDVFINKKPQILDLYLLFLSVFSFSYLGLWIRYYVTTHHNRVMISIITKLLNSIQIIRQANEKGIKLDTLEKQGLFFELQQELSSLIGAPVEQQDKAFMNTKGKTIN